MTDSDERQVAENALCADDKLSPVHFCVIFPTTWGSRAPQRDLRSAGLAWTLYLISTLDFMEKIL